MDDEEIGGPPAAAVLARKLGPLPIWAWGLIAGVALFLLSRGLRGGPRASAAASQVVSAEERQAQEYLRAEQARRAQMQAALDEMELARARREFELYSLFTEAQKYALQREAALQKGLAEKVAALGPSRYKCPSGRTTVDPSTGQIYCRREEDRGFFSNFNLGKLLDIYAKHQGGVVLN